MALKNKYVKNSKITEAKFRQLVNLFVNDLDAQTIASLVKLNKNTVNRYLKLIRTRIAEFCETQSPLKDTIKVSEPDHYDSCIEDQRGHNSSKGLPIFGVFECHGKVYTEVVPDCDKATLKGIVRGLVDPDSIIHSDGWRNYNGLIDTGHNKLYCLNHCHGEFAKNQSHFNNIESFWSYIKKRLKKFYLIPESTLYLHIKECEFRFNYRDEDIYLLLLKIFRNRPLSQS